MIKINRNRERIFIFERYLLEMIINDKPIISNPIWTKW